MQDEPLPAHTINEMRCYLRVTPCQACGQGPWEIDAALPVPAEGETVILNARCCRCRREQPFVFQCGYALGDRGAEAECINPSDASSQIIDLGQWLSLFYLLVETASSEPFPPTSRRHSYRAALCLAEALKFYGEDDELPPESAFFTPASQDAFHKHPEKFARQKLRDMQDRLPALPTMARRIDRDEQKRRRPWWRFWRR